jgi:hypothetical protein
MTIEGIVGEIEPGEKLVEVGKSGERENARYHRLSWAECGGLTRGIDRKCSLCRPLRFQCLRETRFAQVRSVKFTWTFKALWPKDERVSYSYIIAREFLLFPGINVMWRTCFPLIRTKKSVADKSREPNSSAISSARFLLFRAS